MRLRLVLIAVVALLLPLRSFSVPDRAEHILDFHSDITLEPDGTFLVRETITVNATGAQIRHGTISSRLGPRNFPANLAQPARRHRPAPVTRLPFIPVRTGMVLPRQDFPAVLPAALPALSLPLRPLPDPRMVRAAAPAAVVVAVGAAAGNFAADYQPVRYSRFRKSFAVATFVTRIFSPS